MVYEGFANELSHDPNKGERAGIKQPISARLGKVAVTAICLIRGGFCGAGERHRLRVAAVYAKIKVKKLIIND